MSFMASMIFLVMVIVLVVDYRFDNRVENLEMKVKVLIESTEKLERAVKPYTQSLSSSRVLPSCSLLQRMNSLEFSNSKNKT